MAAVGLVNGINEKTSPLSSSSSASSRRLLPPDRETVTADVAFNIPPSGIIPKRTMADIMFPVSVEDQQFIVRCMAKHGDDYARMSWDIKLNNEQYTENQLRKLGNRFLKLEPGQRRVDVPDKIKHLVILEEKEGEEV
eukprot:CAMPEP_0172503886 /NCGR_PEP_ID=MMETSP1066-20121228/173370_1 /TAXON_ID=671091 /ORGANISM="Coscinodiscus wailesii, Strain CCMP2513" /LENGTH=137 /DNA_ID=CAMNT_0013279815 /DNA_START=217 /DNA_END=630 /DNA_ORIENTATION=+